MENNQNANEMNSFAAPNAATTQGVKNTSNAPGDNATKPLLSDNQQIASPYFRLAAYLVDVLINITVLQFLILNIANRAEIANILSSLLTLIIAALALFGIFIPFLQIYLTSRLGGSVGKLVFDMHVVNSKGAYLSLSRAFFRNYIGYIVSNILLKLGFVWIFIDKERRAWHDQISGTWVTVKGRGVSLLGVILLSFLLISNIILTFNNYQKLKTNINIYKIFVLDIFDEVKQSWENETTTKEEVKLPDQTPSEHPFEYEFEENFPGSF